MKKIVSVLAMASVFIAGSAFASGYRIPEQSADSMAKAGANIASASGPDTAYYNPANLSWMTGGWQIEADLNYIHLTSVDYTDTRSSTLDASSEKENFLIPTLFVVSPEYNNFRFGFSVTTPYGLAKRWENTYPKTFVSNFNLKTHDINPTVAYKINKMFSIAGGVRLIYGTAGAKNEGIIGLGPSFSGDISGDALEWGYNLAVSMRPNEKSNISITYRSHVDLEAGTDNTLTIGATTINTKGDTTIPTPAVLSIAGAYTFDKLTVELAWDRTFWSKYKTLDFNFDTVLPAPLDTLYDTPTAKNWADSDAIRIGLEYVLNDCWTLMGGFAYDQNPIPGTTLGFETPDSDAWLFSLGARYKVNEQVLLSMGVLYDYKEKRSESNGRVEGTLENSSALLVSLGMRYMF